MSRRQPRLVGFCPRAVTQCQGKCATVTNLPTRQLAHADLVALNEAAFCGLYPDVLPEVGENG